MEKLYLILKRESLGLNEGLKAAIEEYVERHGEGNYQTLMASFTEGGPQSQGQLEQEIFRYLQGRAAIFGELSMKQIRETVEGTLGLTGRKIVAAADRIAQLLHDDGIRVWR